MCESAWTVAFAGLWLKMWTTGIFKSVGSLYVTFMSTFNCSYKEAAWPGSLSISVMCATGPIAGILTYFISCRMLLGIGTLLTSLSLLACYWSTSIFQITLIYGLGVGFGIGLIECICPIFVAQNFFKQRRAVGVGITMIGSSIGQFFLPIVVSKLLEFTDLHGTFLILAGLSLHGFIGVVLLKPVSNRPPESPSPLPSPKYGSMTSTRSTSPPAPTLPPLRPPEESHECCPRPPPTRTASQTYWDSGEFGRVDLTIDRGGSGCCWGPHGPTNHPYYAGRFICDICNPEALANTVLGEQSSADLSKGGKGALYELRKFLSLFFLSSTLAYAMAHFGIYSIVTILPDYALERGFTHQQSYLFLSLNAVAELVGKFLSGWLSYYKLFTNTEAYFISGLALGLVYVLLSLVLTPYAFIVLIFANGYFGGAILILMPVLATEYVGSKRAALGFGLCTLLAGIMSIARPSLIEMAMNATETYDGLFLFDGVALLGATLLLVAAYLYQRVKGKRT